MPLAAADFIKENPEYNKIILQLLFNRGLIGKEALKIFFEPDKVELSDPFLFKDMAEAVDLAVRHIKEQNLIVIYGDYDADGVTASAALVEVLAILKAKISVYIPGRSAEGYGLNKKAVDKLAEAGAKLIITVDNGIRNQEEAAYAKSKGLDIIITDHHEPPAERSGWPDCLIINPKAEYYPYKSLAGVGVAFKFAQALISRAKLDKQTKAWLENKILDLVAIGTVADMVSLLGENRALVWRGLKAINGHKRLGVNELIKAARVNGNLSKKINALNIGWQIAPRLNSAGRLDHANTAYELLVSKDADEAREIAEKLNDKNSQRQKITERITDDCRRQIDKQQKGNKILIVCAPKIDDESAEDWPEGVVGLVAGRLCEQYGRPVLAITKAQGEIRGSGRSTEGFNIMKAVERAGQYLKKFGGHALACGFTVKSKEDLIKFSEKMEEQAEQALSGVELSRKIYIEAAIDLAEADDRLAGELEKFEPFGQGNEQPKFLSRNLLIADKMSMGNDGRHVKLRFGSVWAVVFGRAEEYKDYKIGDKVDLVYYLEFNEFNGRKAVQMKIVDIKLTV